MNVGIYFKSFYNHYAQKILIWNAAKLTAVQRKFGEYWSNLDTRSTASGGSRLWKTCKIKVSTNQMKLML